MGDLLLSVPALRHLKASIPDCYLGLLIGPWNAEAARGIPHVDEVLTLPFPWFDRRPTAGLLHPYRLLLAEATRLRTGRWDTALVLRHDFWWGAMLAAWADIPRRIGYGSPEALPFLTHSVPYKVAHEVEQTMALAEALSGRQSYPMELEFRASMEDAEAAGVWLAEQGLVGSFAVVHPGAGAPVKEWNAGKFAAVIAGLALPVVVTGSPGEEALARAVAGPAGARLLVGAPLGQVAAVLARASLAIGVDSGIMHLAAAVGTPTVRLFGPADASRFGPWGDPNLQRVVRSEPACVPCNRLEFSPGELPLHPCMRSIPVEAVLAAAQPLLAAVESRRGHAQSAGQGAHDPWTLDSGSPQPCVSA